MGKFQDDNTIFVDVGDKIRFGFKRLRSEVLTT
jgi:hypothetical protein